MVTTHKGWVSNIYTQEYSIFKYRGVSLSSVSLFHPLYTHTLTHLEEQWGLILPRAQGVVLTLWKGASDCREVPLCSEAAQCMRACVYSHTNTPWGEEIHITGQLLSLEHIHSSGGMEQIWDGRDTFTVTGQIASNIYILVNADFYSHLEL